ncbi:MAG: D-glycero-beta-D-manno-heptose 1-phosphate adenylyltransferase [Candidatus Omnitrophica bacterium]|nr:D-glycero-beta-D-manno-heptose 1-phosphate adenylyltransferase [Candidatus Omnitrophota bacterium]MCM8802202.1 D-glycero-beta-D-manno-heptose 1-phosphate adenylyltransferase [Candidatus Omnitrophota bacterium]
MHKVKTIEEIKKISLKLKREGKTIVFTNGCFDIIHPGHIRVLKKAKSMGDILIVGLNSDKSIRMIKGKGRPIIDQKGRCEILSCFSMVDYVVIFEEKTPKKLIKTILPNFIIKGGDYKEEEVIGKDIIKKYGGKVIIVPLYKKYSTTNLIRKIYENFKDY